MGNVMLLKPFETSLSIVYKVKAGKGDVEETKSRNHRSANSKTRRGWLSHAYICRNGKLKNKQINIILR